ncbi:MAG: NAD(P)H-binding protein, partial [Acidimicrobiia bacterium]|nr:NAD(P)H-binding protein [Acidimicrobiia bacterium]
MMTGATGFIGGHTAARAIQAGHEVCALVRSPQKLEALCDAFDLPPIDFVVGDMTDPDAVTSALHGADAAIHCAAVVSLDARGNAQGIKNSIAGARLVLHQAHAMGL